MRTDELAEKLADLVMVDIDAVAVYDEVMTRVDDERIRLGFQAARSDHVAHSDKLRAVIADLGETPPERKPDLSGRLAELYASVRSMTGNEGALKAMRTAERYHVDRYEKAMAWELPGDLHEVIESFYGDERRHLALVEELLGAGART